MGWLSDGRRTNHGSPIEPSSPLGIMANIGGAMGNPCTGVCGAQGMCKNQHKAAFYQRQADGTAPCVCVAGVANLCPTELSFATQTAGASGNLFIFFFLLDEILWLHTL